MTLIHYMATSGLFYCGTLLDLIFFFTMIYSKVYSTLDLLVYIIHKQEIHK